MDEIELTVTNREILGKKVKHLRRQGITPVHLFGHGIESLSLQCDTDEAERVLGQAGQTRLISLKLNKEKRPRTVVVREFDRDWRKGQEAPALKSKANMLDHELGTLTVECLPAKIPASLEVDISSLTETEQTIRVKDVALDKDITVLNDPELVVVKISSRPVEKIEEEVVEVVEEAEEVVEEGGAPEEAPSGEETEEA